MKYQEHTPAPGLVPFIDCYWTLRGDALPESTVRRVMPDICADIIFNFGEQVQVWNGQGHQLKSDKAYLVGTMTTCQDTLLQPGTHLVGIRFKPFGLGALLNIRLRGAADQIEELGNKSFPLDFGCCLALGTQTGHDTALEKLNAWLLRRINGVDNARMNSMIGTILAAQGKISVGELSRQYHTTERQLERQFGEIVGVPLKEICNLTRFQHAYQLIRSRGERSLLDIAFEAGYYDHAHLAKHFKRYAGYTPSQVP